MCSPHPRGEVQLTLHLPTRRQKEPRLSASDSRLNPRPPLRRRLIRHNGGDDPGEEADGRGDEKEGGKPLRQSPGL